jgi:hypothetical protein
MIFIGTFFPNSQYRCAGLVDGVQGLLFNPFDHLVNWDNGP